MQVATKNLTATTTIARADGFYRIAIKAQGGDISIIGNGTFQGNLSEAITISENESFFMTAEPGAPIDGLTIIPGGNVAVLQAFNG